MFFRYCFFYFYVREPNQYASAILSNVVSGLPMWDVRSFFFVFPVENLINFYNIGVLDLAYNAQIPLYAIVYEIFDLNGRIVEYRARKRPRLPNSGAVFHLKLNKISRQMLRFCVAWVGANWFALGVDNQIMKERNFE